MSDSCPNYIARNAVPTHFPICQRVVDQWIADDTVPFIRLGRKVIFRRIDIEIYLDAHRSVPVTKAKVGRPTKAVSIARRNKQAAA